MSSYYQRAPQPPVTLENAFIYDLETYPNCFTFAMEFLNSGTKATWEISEFRNDAAALFEFLQWVIQVRALGIGFNNLHFDYPIVHAFINNPNMTYQELYTKADSIINGGDDRFAHSIWPSDRFFPQLDLLKMHHFDNKAKRTSLKALQVNMRSPSVVDLPIAAGTLLTELETNTLLKPYGEHDVTKTKEFTGFSMDAINMRLALQDQFGDDILNWNDTKIGEKIMEKRIGEDICYDRSSGKKKRRQTYRTQVALADIIFPYIQFEHPEFNRVLAYLKEQVLKADDFAQFDEEAPSIVTKGVFKDLHAVVGGVRFDFGTGGIHASVSSQRIYSSPTLQIVDVDVAGYYPNLIIVNGLAPAHLGDAFVREYAQLPVERKKWQELKGKKCAEANSFKLAGNGVYGKSNSKYSVFFDPQLTMSTTVNGQMMLCMLAEQLLKVPTLSIIQANTDGLTYSIHPDYRLQADEICRWWEGITRLTLEYNEYESMFIRDVNSYIAVGKDDSVKLKGAYWTPDPLNWHDSISNAQPPAWHKNISNVVSTRAAVAHMIHGVPIEQFIRMCTNPYDFTLMIKVKRSDELFLGGEQIQRTSRYYVSVDGGNMVKKAPSSGPEGAYKKANGVTDEEYARVMAETGGAWDERVCTKNGSKYEERETNIQSGFKVSLVNDIGDFRFDNINYDWYVEEARKLLV